MIRTDLALMDEQETVCELCEGRRFTPEVLAYTVDGLTIAEVDALSIAEATERLPTMIVAGRDRAPAMIGP